MRILPLLFFLGMLQVCKVSKTDTMTGKFAVEYSDDFWGDSKRLIQAVHKPEWTIAYTIYPRCKTYKLPKDKVFEDAISRAIRLWLEPIKTVAATLNRKIEVELNYVKLNTKVTKTVKDYVKQLQKEQILLEENNVDMHIVFNCLQKRSRVTIDAYKRSSILIYPTTHDKHWAKGSGKIGNSPFSFGVLFHEIGHAFGLLDTYPPRDGGQPASIMSCSLAGDALGEDDIKAIQWLYRYIYAKESISKDNPCFFADYEQKEGQKFGICLPKHPAITLLKQAEAHERLGKTDVAIRILEKTKQAIAEHLSTDINKINAQDKDGNTALHLAIKYFLASEKINTLKPSWWPTANYPPLYWAAVGMSLLNLRNCPKTSGTGEKRIQEMRLIYERCVRQRNNNCVCIEPRITNKAGKTARDFAMEVGANDIVQAIDNTINRSNGTN